MVVGRGTRNTLRPTWPSPSVLTQEAWLLHTAEKFIYWTLVLGITLHAIYLPDLALQAKILNAEQVDFHWQREAKSSNFQNFRKTTTPQ